MNQSIAKDVPLFRGEFECRGHIRILQDGKEFTVPWGGGLF